MTIEIKVPVLPESVADATIATWHVKARPVTQLNETRTWLILKLIKWF